MKTTLLLIPALAISLFAGGKSALAQYGYPPPFAYGHSNAEAAWEQRGFYDGIKGADRDYGNHRQPNVNNREEYRDPDDIPRWARHEYREGFRAGYYREVRRIYGSNGFEGGYWRDWR